MMKLLFFVCFLLCVVACKNNTTSSVSDSDSTKVVKSEIVIPNDSTIQNRILGMTLAQTSMDSAMVIMRNLGNPLKKIGKDQYVNTDGITFGGVNWEAVYVLSYQDVVSTIKFASRITPKNKVKMDGISKELFGMLKQKYPILFAKRLDYIDSDNSLLLMDEKTFVALGPNLIGDQLVLMLSYGDLLLDDKWNESGYYEL